MLEDIRETLGKLKWLTGSRTPACGSTSIALQAGAVADQGEVAAFGAAVAFVALHAGGADAFEAEVRLRHW